MTFKSLQPETAMSLFYHPFHFLYTLIFFFLFISLSTVKGCLFMQAHSLYLSRLFCFGSDSDTKRQLLLRYVYKKILI